MIKAEMKKQIKNIVLQVVWTLVVIILATIILVGSFVVLPLFLFDLIGW